MQNLTYWPGGQPPQAVTIRVTAIAAAAGAATSLAFGVPLLALAGSFAVAATVAAGLTASGDALLAELRRTAPTTLVIGRNVSVTSWDQSPLVPPDLRSAKRRAQLVRLARVLTSRAAPSALETFPSGQSKN